MHITIFKKINYAQMKLIFHFHFKINFCFKIGIWMYQLKLLLLYSILQLSNYNSFSLAGEIF
ncbi:MAG: hypothetical protein A2007_04380 [Verrucomicrobia bacterium GWC2_42_7]|nr:MAG: hypothetical protein A2007_04380 [Verrucomicrobia bacterium GWC2_42_7]